MLTLLPAAHPWSLPEGALRQLEPVLPMCETEEQPGEQQREEDAWSRPWDSPQLKGGRGWLGRTSIPLRCVFYPGPPRSFVGLRYLHPQRLYTLYHPLLVPHTLWLVSSFSCPCSVVISQELYCLCSGLCLRISKWEPRHGTPFCCLWLCDYPYLSLSLISCQE